MFEGGLTQLFHLSFDSFRRKFKWKNWMKINQLKDYSCQRISPKHIKVCVHDLWRIFSSMHTKKLQFINYKKRLQSIFFFGIILKGERKMGRENMAKKYTTRNTNDDKVKSVSKLGQTQSKFKIVELVWGKMYFNMD